MRRVLVLIVSLLALLPALALAHGDVPHNALHVEPGAVHDGDLSTVDQDIWVDGTVSGDVTSIGGGITVRGTVEGDVVTWGGNIVLGPQAQVRGNVMAVSGSVRREQSGQVAGEVFNGNLNQAGFASLIPGSSGQELSFGARLGLSSALLVLGALIAVLLGRLWRRAIESGATVIHLVPLRAVVLGLLTSALLAVGLGLLLLLLTFTLIGIVAAPIVLLLAHVPLLAGVSSGGRALERWLDVDRAGGVLGTLLLLLPAFLLALWAPLAGLIAFHVAAAAGVGALLLLRSAALRFQTA